ncbi:MAG: cell envelope integrity protein CreD [Opitutaceae bacterium]
METSPVVPPPLPAATNARGLATGLKLVAIGFLIALLWIALLLIDGVRRERLGFREEARAEIAQTWGGEQTLAGPVLVVPFTYAAKMVREVNDSRGIPVRTEEVRTVRATACFLPTELEVVGMLDPSLRQRGIFTVPVYEARLALHGRFSPNAAALGIDGATFEWAKARLFLGLSYPRGLRAAPVLAWGGQQVVLEPGAPREGWGETLEAAVKFDAAGAAAGVAFSAEMTVQGSARLAIAPVGAQNRVALKSSWADPSFGGAALPTRRTVGAEGFEATWEQSYFGRGYPQQWTEGAGQGEVTAQQITNSAIDVTLLQPVDAYRLVERAIKYGVLFLVLVFANFFLFEVTARLRIHPLQYLMVGAALVLFFLGYLALSEFLAAGLAYGAAAAASTALVAGYSASVLRTGKRCLVVGAGLAGTYAYLYFILQLQDYALLAGTGALFVLLGVGMWVTRKIDWYGGKAA